MAVEVVRGGRRLPRRFRRSSLALGNFDGVHTGHLALFERVRAHAAREGGDAVVYTFDPHPVAFLFPQRAPVLLTTLEQKVELIGAAGIPTVVLATFDAEYAAQPPDAFARDVLAEALDARAVVVGQDFTFGRDRAGAVAHLAEFGRRYGFVVDVVPPIADGSGPISSTRIRRAVAAGRVEEAARLLGRPYAVRGPVVRGRRRGGAALGFPTANVASENPLLPAGGVYAGWVTVLDQARPAAPCYRAAVNVGTSPTFEPGGPVTVEAHLLDFAGDLYGARIEVAFAERLRDERRFPDPAALAAQIAADVDAVRRRLS